MMEKNHCGAKFVYNLVYIRKRECQYRDKWIIVSTLLNTIGAIGNIYLKVVKLFLNFAVAICIHLISLSVFAVTEYAGSFACQTCHKKEYQEWQSSHHAASMQLTNLVNVLGDFKHTVFVNKNHDAKFFVRNKKYYVSILNKDQKYEEYELPYTFGVYPLQQYLMSLPNGKFQALTIAWDARSKAEGGQRWFDLYPDQNVSISDPLHWSSSLHNWNSRCASCHSTNLEKNYDLSNNSYKTQWSELNVACESCHGSAKNHQGWLNKPNFVMKNKGFKISLKSNAIWQKKSERSTAENIQKVQAEQQTQVCANCHSLREQMNDTLDQIEFHQQFRSSNLTAEHFFADGQIKDEVFEYDSFLQSKMYAMGVICSDCHNPHNSKLKQEGNRLCTQCHEPKVFDTPLHSHHEINSAGSQCINCHMPPKNFMVIDARHDHSFSLPRPDLTVSLGMPNACNQCHQNKNAQWSVESMKSWNLQHSNQQHLYASIFDRAWNEDARDQNKLFQLIAKEDTHSIVKASALQTLASFPSKSSYKVAVQALQSKEARERVAAIRALKFLDVDNREVLFPLIKDVSKSVRIELAPLLAEIPKAKIPPAHAENIKLLFDEYINLQARNADMHESQEKLGEFYMFLGESQKAEAAYKQSLKIMPSYLPALINLSGLYKSRGNIDSERKYLQIAIDFHPTQAEPFLAMGLLEVRLSKLSVALPLFKKAHLLNPQSPQIAYVFAAGLYKNGQINKAIDVLELTLTHNPSAKELLEGLIFYSKAVNNTDKVKKYESDLRQLNFTLE